MKKDIEEIKRNISSYVKNHVSKIESIGDDEINDDYSEAIEKIAEGERVSSAVECDVECVESWEIILNCIKAAGFAMYMKDICYLYIDKDIFFEVLDDVDCASDFVEAYDEALKSKIRECIYTPDTLDSEVDEVEMSRILDSIAEEGGDAYEER